MKDLEQLAIDLSNRLKEVDSLDALFNEIDKEVKGDKS